MKRRLLGAIIVLAAAFTLLAAPAQAAGCVWSSGAWICGGTLPPGEQVEATRLGGADRYATAVEITQHGWPDGADVVYIANGGDFPDALAGAALGAPILLVHANTVPAVVAAELARLAPSRVIALGGPGAVSDAALQAAATAAANG